MSWKSTKDITRQQAVYDIVSNLEKLDNWELESVMDVMFGDNDKLPHYGSNFNITTI